MKPKGYPVADDLLSRIDRLSAPTPPPGAAPSRGFMAALKDNVIGVDDGVESLGEGLATWLNLAGESATLGVVGDEAAAGLDALTGRGSYDERLTARRRQESDYRSNHPVLSVGADLAGAVAPGLGWAGAASRGANLATRMASAGAAGAGGGALQGFMEGENGAGNRIYNGTVGALVGGGAGLALPGIAQGLGALYRRIGPGAARALREAEGKLGLRGAATDFVARAVDQDAAYAGPIIAEAGPDALNAQMGPNSTALLDFVASKPGPSATRVRQGVNTFAQGQREAFERSLDDTMGLPEGIARRQSQMMQDTAASRRAAYEAAYGAPIDWETPAGRRLAELVDRLRPGDTARARDIMQMEGAPIRSDAMYRTTAEGIEEIPMPNVQELDYATRALNDVGFATGAGPEVAGASRNLARNIRRTLDELVPEYQAARAAGQDVIANRNALEFGKTLLQDSVTMDVAEDALADMTDAERRFVAAAVRDTIAERIANANRALSDPLADARDALKPLQDLTNAAGERKLRALLGDRADEVIRSSRAAYQALSLRSRVGGNSATMPRQAWQAELDVAIPRGPQEALQADGFTAALGTAANRLAGDPAAARMAQQQDMLDAIGSLLMQPMRSPDNPLPMVSQLPQLLAAAQRNAGYVAGDGARLGGIAGALGVGAATRPRN